ncbi:hypothetical protein HRED_04729 [Candidatus Haloredivivus sp. G17]|nr:hypothetical protein HRED_04729 [Candidatus Haloredivivus sp. G17]
MRSGKQKYIVENYNFLSQPTFSDAEKGLKINQRIKPDDLEKTRDWFVENIKGLGMKEALTFSEILVTETDLQSYLVIPSLYFMSSGTWNLLVTAENLISHSTADI